MWNALDHPLFKLFVFNEGTSHSLYELFLFALPRSTKKLFPATCIVLFTFCTVPLENFPFPHASSHLISSSHSYYLVNTFYSATRFSVVQAPLFSLHPPLYSYYNYLFNDPVSRRCEDTSGPAAN